MIRVAVITVSDSSAAGTRENVSGPAIETHCEKLGWHVAGRALVPDEEDAIERELRGWVDDGVSLILTTGGTGIAPRDVTPEATRRVIEREIPGIPELMRLRGLEDNHFAVLSRAVAGAVHNTLIVNLPGSPRGAVNSLRAIENLVGHVADLLRGATAH